MPSYSASLNALPQIDYERMMQAKEAYLHELYQQEGRKAMATDDFARFFSDNGQWLVPYAQYCYLRDTYRTTDFAQWQGHATWNEADRPALSNSRSPKYHQVAYYYYVQYILHCQMTAAHDHARQHGVVLKGDIPIGVHRQGCDVWMEPRYFCLDGQAGARPTISPQMARTGDFPRTTGTPCWPTAASGGTAASPTWPSTSTLTA